MFMLFSLRPCINILLIQLAYQTRSDFGWMNGILILNASVSEWFWTQCPLYVQFLNSFGQNGWILFSIECFWEKVLAILLENHFVRNRWISLASPLLRGFLDLLSLACLAVVSSRIGRVFFNPTLRLRCWDATSFCMQ